MLLRLAAASINAFYSNGRLDDPEEWLRSALAHEAALSPGLRARCHTALALAAEMRGDFFAASEHARTAIAVADDPAEAGGAYSILVANLSWIDPDEAERMLARAPEWTVRIEPHASTYVRAARGSLALARQDYQRAVELLQPADSRVLVGGRTFELTVAHLMCGDADRAAAAIEEGVAHADAAWFEYYVPLLRALVAAVRGDRACARDELRKAVTLVRRWKVPLGLADCVLACAVIAFHAGAVELAAELLAAVKAATGGGLRSPMTNCVYRHYVGAARAALSADVRAKARAAGMGLALEAALARELGEAT